MTEFVDRLEMHGVVRKHWVSEFFTYGTFKVDMYVKKETSD